jgi:2-phospho-L-lactate/phosphoenolpyruvate guanylyltransferase
MMPLWAIIPIKPLRCGKSRLSTVLTNQERENLNHNLLIHSINCLKQVVSIDQILVISHDPVALSYSRGYGVRTIQENRNTNINYALRKATRAAIAFSASSILIIPADLPLMTPDDIDGLISKSNSAMQIIISPDRKMYGTNALYISPPGILDYDFGEWSFKKHIEQAERKKIKVEIYNNERLGFDLDLPEDLKLFRETKTSSDLLMNPI